MTKEWLFDIDIVGGCNLRCPSCPVGNSDYSSQPQGFMSPDLLEQIVKKAVRECGLPVIGLYNWTEPFLHPRLPEMIRRVNKYGVQCGISTNLNVMRNLDEVLIAEPRYIRISVSGFTQDVYGRHHKRGNIEKVKANMIAMAEAKKRLGSSTTLKIIYHRYLNNHDDEASMREFAKKYGFGFDVVWAFMMPAEKNIAIARDGLASPEITDEDRELLARLALPLDRALEIGREYVDSPCLLQTSRVSITHEGKVMLCCSVFDQSRFQIGDYLELPLDEIQRRRMAHSYCAECSAAGVHALSSYLPGPEFDRIALANVHEHFPNVQMAGVLGKRKKKSIVSRTGAVIRDFGRRLRKTYARIRNAR